MKEPGGACNAGRAVAHHLGPGEGETTMSKASVAPAPGVPSTGPIPAFPDPTPGLGGGGWIILESFTDAAEQ